NVAKRSAGVGRAVLGHRLLLFGNLERLDGQRDLAGLAIDLGDAGIDLVALGETLGTLIGAIAAQVGAADERRHLRVGNLDLDAAVVDIGDRAGHDRALLDAVAAFGELTGRKLLDA